jgi:hypothetical protein
MDVEKQLLHVSSPKLRSILGISRTTFYRLLQAGLPCRGTGRLRRHPLLESLDWYGTDKEARTLAPGRYACRGCGFIGNVDSPTPVTQARCPKCRGSNPALIQSIHQHNKEA